MHKLKNSFTVSCDARVADSADIDLLLVIQAWTLPPRHHLKIPVKLHVTSIGMFMKCVHGEQKYKQVLANRRLVISESYFMKIRSTKQLPRAY